MIKAAAKRLCACLLLTLAGCAHLNDQQEKVARDWDADAAKVAEYAKQPVTQSPMTESVVRRVDGYYLGGRNPVPLRAALPEAAKRVNVTIAQPMTLSQIAEMVQRLSGIPVRLAPDVYRPRKLATTGAPAPAVKPLPTPLAVNALHSTPLGLTVAAPAALSPGEAAAGSSSLADTAISLRFNGTLVDFLDQVSAQFGVNWSYSDRTINVYRYVTRTFRVPLAPEKTQLRTETGFEDQGAGGGGGGGDSGGKGGKGEGAVSGAPTMQAKATQSAKSSYDVDFWAGFESGLKGVLSAEGQFSVNRASGLVIVSDTRDAIERTARYVDAEILAMSREVQLYLEVYSVRMSDADALGVNWEVLYNRLNRVDPRLFVNVVSPGVLSIANPAQINIANPITDYNNPRGMFEGSGAAVKALSTLGKVSRVTTLSMQAGHNRKSVVTKTLNTNYLAATTASVANGTNTGNVVVGGPGLVPGVLSTGLTLTMLPVIADDTTIRLNLVGMLSQPETMRRANSGGLSIDLPEWSSNVFDRSASVRAGETVVFLGFENTVKRSSNSGLTRDLPMLLGGSAETLVEREWIVFVARVGLSQVSGIGAARQ